MAASHQRYGRGITRCMIDGTAYYKVQLNRQAHKRVQRHFKSYEPARLFAIEMFREIGLPESRYAMLLDPAFYSQFDGD